MRSHIRASSFRFPGFLLLGDGKPGNRSQADENVALWVSLDTSENYAG